LCADLGQTSQDGLSASPWVIATPRAREEIVDLVAEARCALLWHRRFRAKAPLSVTDTPAAVMDIAPLQNCAKSIANIHHVDTKMNSITIGRKLVFLQQLF
jgi:hypothetical protein